MSTDLYPLSPSTPATAVDFNQIIAALTGTNDIAALTCYQPLANAGALTAAVGSGTGNLDGVYSWVVVWRTGWIDGRGQPHYSGNQTAAGTPSNAVSATNNPVDLTAIPIGPAGVIARDLYRTKAGGSTYYFLVTLADNVVTEYTDNTADADLGSATAPTVNTTGTIPQLPVYPSVPGFSAVAGTIIAVTVASGTTVLYRSDGSGWLPVPDLDVANTWTAVQTLDSAVLAGTTTNSGTISGGDLTPSTVTASTTVYVKNSDSGITPGTTAGTYLGIGDVSNLFVKGYGFVPAINASGLVLIGSVGTSTLNFDGSLSNSGSTYGSWKALASTGANALQLAPAGSVTTQHNTLDNGSGDASIAGQQTVQDLAVSGITGATTASRYVGGTSGGAPTTGTFAVNDYVVDSASQTLWLCTAGGSPGTWVKASPSPATDTTAGIVEIPQTPSGTPVSTVIMARPAEIELTTTSATTIFTETPANTGMFVVYLYARVVTATTTVTATLTYTSTSGAQTYTIWNAQNLPVGDNSAVPFFFQNVGGDAIELSCTAGTANQVYIDARLVAM